jgi:hypothetical protein
VTTPPDGGTPPGKTSITEFLGAMPSGFADVFKPVYERWVQRGYIFSWGTVGFSIRVNDGGKSKGIYEIYPTSFVLFTRKWERSRALPSDVCQRFRDRIKRYEKLSGLVSQDRSYFWYKDLSLDEYIYLIDEVDKTLEELHQYYLTTGIPQESSIRTIPDPAST